ncbi:hypothetical protein S83_063024, partial [Arachis hypogaea]
NIVTAISELLRFGAAFSVTFAITSSLSPSRTSLSTASRLSSSSSAWPTTEKQRREQLNGKYKILRSFIPSPTKMDRASVVGDAIEYNKGAAQNGLNQNSTLQLSCGFHVGKSLGSNPGVAVVVERVRIRGLSRFRNLNKFAHSMKVKVLPADPNIRIPNIEICFHRNASLAIGMCSQGQWEKVTKGSWIRSMSLFDHKLLDIRTASSTLASSLSKSLAFYYSSAMAVGIILVILMILYQMKKHYF